MQNKSLKSFINDPERIKLLKIERELLALSRVPQEYIEIGDLAITDTELIHYTIVAKTAPDFSPKSNNVLLFVHGFGGCGAMFYKMVKALADDFYLVLIDLPGFGFSSRPAKQPFDSIHSCIDFFVDRFKTFVDKLEMPLFSVVGHSLGAFVASHLFDRHHERVQRLFLLSPAGMNPPLKDQVAQFRQFHKERNRFAQYFIHKVADKIFETKISPFDLLCWPFKGIFIKVYLSSKRFNFSEKERELMAALMRYFIDQPQCGERSIGFILHYGLMSPRPITEVLQARRERAESVSIMWGDHDFMDKDYSVERLNELGLEDVRIGIAKNSDHQLPFQAMEDVKTEILMAFGSSYNHSALV